jgi:hypothetical protein
MKSVIFCICESNFILLDATIGLDLIEVEIYLTDSFLRMEYFVTKLWSLVILFELKHICV